jgi:hypothetical protein
VDEKAYLDANRFPLSSQRGLDLKEQMLIDSVNLDELERAEEYGQKLSQYDLETLAELREKRRLRQGWQAQPPAGRPPE